MKNFKRKLVTLGTALVMAIGLLVVSNVLSVKAEAYVTPNEKIEIHSLLTNKSISDNNSDRMVPQGICVTPNYILISAYSYDDEVSDSNKANPLIYVFSKDKNFIGTLILPVKSHVGGLAYDGSNVWVSVGEKVASFSASTQIKALEKRAADKSIPASERRSLNIKKYDSRIKVDIQASTLGYDSVNKRLWVGNYSDTGSSYAYSYEVTKDADGNLGLKQDKRIDVPRHTQGIAFKGDKLLISTSCNVGNPSTIYAYKWNQKQNKKDLIGSYTLPPMSEGVVMGSDGIYVVFESAAKRFYGTKDSVNYFARYSYSKFGF